MFTTCRKSFAAVVLVLLVASSVAAQDLSHAVPEEVGLSSARLARLSAAFDEYVEKGQLAGATVLVARNGRVAYLEAFGYRDREAGAKQQVDDIFRIASQSKAIVSVAIMMLQEEGRLLISDPLSWHLPEFATTMVAVGKEEGGFEVVPAERAIRLRDLLTHTSGIGYGGGPGAQLWADAEIQGWYLSCRRAHG